MSSRLYPARMAHRGHTPEHNLLAKHDRRKVRAVERRVCREWELSVDVDLDIPPFVRTTPCRSDKGGYAVGHEAFYAFLRTLVGRRWAEVQDVLMRRFGATDLGRRSVDALCTTIELAQDERATVKTPFVLSFENGHTILRHPHGAKPAREARPPRSNYRLEADDLDSWDSIISKELRAWESAHRRYRTESGLSLAEYRRYSNEWLTDRGSDVFTRVHHVWTQMTWEEIIRWAFDLDEIELYDLMDRYIEHPLDDTFAPERTALPSERHYKGKQWNRHALRGRRSRQNTTAV